MKLIYASRQKSYPKSQPEILRMYKTVSMCRKIRPATQPKHHKTYIHQTHMYSGGCRRASAPLTTGVTASNFRQRDNVREQSFLHVAMSSGLTRKCNAVMADTIYCCLHSSKITWPLVGQLVACLLLVQSSNKLGH